MNIDPSEFFQKLGTLQQNLSENHAMVEYHSTRVTLEIARFCNELKNPATTASELDVIRDRCHDILDQYLDAQQSHRQLTDQFLAEQKKAQGN